MWYEGMGEGRGDWIKPDWLWLKLLYIEFIQGSTLQNLTKYTIVTKL